MSRRGGTAWQESHSGVTNPGGMGITAWAGGRRLIAGGRAVGLTARTGHEATRATVGCAAGVAHAMAQAAAAAGPVVWVGQRRGVVRLTPGSGGG